MFAAPHRARRRPALPIALRLLPLAALPVLLTLPAVASADVWVADAVLSTGGGDVSMTVTIDDVTEDVDIELSGSDARWFAVGFGTNAMSGTYAIVTRPGGLVEERQLGNHNPGSVIGPTITLDSWTTGGGQATFALSRTIDPGVSGVYVFPIVDVQNGAPIPLIWAVGQSGTFAYHGPGNKAFGSESFAPDGPVSAQEPGMRDASWGRIKLEFRRAG